MNLSKSNLIAKFYELSYREYPKDVCSLFWGTIWALLCLPLSIFTIIYSYYKKENNHTIAQKCVYGIVIYAIYMIGFLLGGTFFTTNNIIPIHWWVFIVYPILGISSFLLVLGIIAGIAFISEKMGTKISRQASHNETSQKIKDVWGAVKGKYCTKITWTE